MKLKRTSTLIAGALMASAGALRAASITATGTVSIDGRAYAVNAPAECHYTANGSIFEVPSAMYQVSISQAGAGLTRVNAAIWQPKAGGPAQITFNAIVGAASHRIVTTKGGTVSGSAVARGEKQGSGLLLTIDGKTASGQTVKMSVACSGFTAPEDNG